jgi:Flp pilus assembly protein TadG
VNPRQQAGTAAVEFAIIGVVAMVVIMALIEFGRMVFVINALSEATRRGARMAVVCPLNDPAIAQVTLFNAPGGGGNSPIISGLTPGNVVVEYLDQNGAVMGNPGGAFTQIRYARVRINNFQHSLLVPLAISTFTLPGYPSTLPRESLGVPRVGAGPLAC